MGVELLIVSAALQAFQGFQQYQAGKAQAKAAQQTANYNAAVAKQQSDLQRRQLVKQQKLFSGSQMVRAASSGATLGSFDDLFESTEQEQLLDLAILDYNSRLERDQINYGGRVEAYSAKQKGKNALISSLSSAAGTGMQAYRASQAPVAPTSKTWSGNTVYWNQTTRAGV